MIRSWLKKRRQRRNHEIANAVISKLDFRGLRKFLPPVVYRDHIFIASENGDLYIVTAVDQYPDWQVTKIGML